MPPGLSRRFLGRDGDLEIRMMGARKPCRRRFETRVDVRGVLSLRWMNTHRLAAGSWGCRVGVVGGFAIAWRNWGIPISRKLSEIPVGAYESQRDDVIYVDDE